VSEQEAKLDGMSDAEIVAGFQATGRDDDGNVWVQELFRRYYEKVVTWCLRIAGDRDDAADLAQGIFVRVQRHLGSFRGDSKFSTWLYSIARSECMNYLKKARSSKRDPADDDELGELPDVGRAAPDEMLVREQSARMVRAMLEEELDDTEKKVFTLHYGDDVPLDAITRLLGLSNRSGAKAYIVSARRKLARAVERLKAGQERLNA
jgi:RNA polymerase sigma-70 factor (ECF subfamily)